MYSVRYRRLTPFMVNYIYNLANMNILFVSGVEGSVQLRGGVVPEAGTVEYCINGAWKAVCDNSWDYKDAFVACRQLGFPATGIET